MEMNKINKYIFIFMGVMLFVTLAIRFAEPIRDGDFFWHYKYGEYHVKHKTLIPDHTLWSWTPADNNVIKCNWIADIFIYFLKQTGGLSLLFAFRYFCMALLMIMIWAYAFKTGQGKKVYTPFILIIVLLGSFTGAYIKTEIFSMLFMAAVPFIYFSVKSSLFKKWGSKAFYLYPLLILIWVNTHEVFLFGMLLLGSIIIGEILNHKFSKSSALSSQAIKNLIKSGLLSILATFITPYGWGADLQYINLFFTQSSEELGLKAIGQYNTIMITLHSPLHFIEFWIIMLVSFVVLFFLFKIKNKKWDWGIFIPMVVMSIISARYLRGFYFMTAFWAMSLLYMTANLKNWFASLNLRLKPAFTVVFLGLFIFFSARSMWEAKYRPFLNRWLGFGIGAFNPVQASDFLKTHKPGHLLYNSYNVGGYLIYDLFPIYKVFCDPRYFPYRSWYKEYWNFNNGPAPLKEFNEKYPFDVAIVDYISSQSPIIKFLRSKLWKPVFYGPSAIVFVKRDNSFNYDYKTLDPHRFDNVKNLNQLYNIYFVAMNLGDYDTSQHVINIMKEKFRGYPGYELIITELQQYQSGIVAYSKNDYYKALKILKRLGSNRSTPRVNFALFNLRNWKAKILIQKGKFKKALRYLEDNLRDRPTNENTTYNAGIIAYRIELMERKNNPEGYKGDNFLAPGEKSKFYLKHFLKLAPNHRHAWIAKQILEGKGMPLNVPLIL